MLKIDAFLRLTAKCYSEVSTKDIGKFKENVRETKVQKRFIYWDKKERMGQREMNSDAIYFN